MLRLIWACLLTLAIVPNSLWAQETDLVKEYQKALRGERKRGISHITVTTKESSLVLNIEFRVNSAELTPDATRKLQALARAISEDPELKTYKYRIEGHTCTTGTPMGNKKLSARRARYVKNFLVQHTLAEDQFATVGYGSDQPIDDNDTEAGRSRNRRVVIVNTRKPVTAGEWKKFNLNVAVKHLKNNEEKELQSGTTLTANDTYSVEFSPNENAYVYVYQITNNKKIEKLFPNKTYSREGNPVAADISLRVPSAGNWLTLDDEKGQEQIIVIAGNKEISNPDSLLKITDKTPQSQGISRGFTVGPLPEQQQTMPVSDTMATPPASSKKMSKASIRKTVSPTLQPETFRWSMTFNHD